MPAIRMHGAFEVLSTRIARLTITRPADGFGLTLDRKQQNHQVGFRDAPVYRLAQPFSPDDGWRIEPDPTGKLVEASSSPAADDDVAERYAAWVAGSRASQGHALLGLLPAGTYLLVRSSRRPVDAARILLGNEWIDAQPNMRVLHDQKPIYALIAGPQRQSPPSLNQPLLGVAVLNYVGESWMHGILFLQLVEPCADDPGDDKDLLLIVPVEGELIIDNMGFFSPTDEQRSRESWRDHLSENFARWCVGEAMASTTEGSSTP